MMVMNLKKIYFWGIKNLICILLFLVLGIICKLDKEYSNYIYNKIYQEHFDFSIAKDFYNNYFGGIFPIESVFMSSLESVFHEDLIYQEIGDYEDGAVLKVDYNYLVPVMNSGMVIYIGEKEKYGNVVIIEGNDGIDIWYGNLCNCMVKLYDVVYSGDYLGEVCSNEFYIVYTKKNKFLDYKEYLN